MPMRLSNLISTLTTLRVMHGDCLVLCGNAEIAGFAVRPKEAANTVIILTKPKKAGPTSMPFEKPST